MSKHSPLQNLTVFERVKIAKIIFRKSQKFTILHFSMYKNSHLLHVIELLRGGLYLLSNELIAHCTNIRPSYIFLTFLTYLH